jgi:uncharacterized protein YqhQ
MQVRDAAKARPYIGGQAVLEGVMMRAPRSFAVVVRRRDGSLHVRERAMADSPGGLARWPFVRGVASLVESLKLGSEALRFSVEQVERDLLAAGTAALSALGLSLFAMATAGDGEGVSSSSSGGARRAGTWVMALVAIAFFVALPQGLAAGVSRGLHLGLEVQSPGFQAITGTFKLVVVVTYLLAIRRVPDIRRVFQFHGAEHKTISTYEAGEDLTVENARAKTTLHPRCGTTFLVMVALVSILVFTAIGAALPRIHTSSVLLDNVVFFLEKLPFLPVIAACTFEMQRIFARYFTRGPLRAVLWPGFLVQKITTAEPDDDQLEVALASLRVTLFRQDRLGPDGASRQTTPSQGGQGEVGDVSFPTYGALLAAERLRPAA